MIKFETKFRLFLKHAEVSSHSWRSLQRSLQTKRLWTALAQAARRRNGEGKQGKGDGKGMRDKGQAQRQNQSQSSNPNMDAVCWHCGKKGHLSTERWARPKNSRASDEAIATLAEENRKVTRANEHVLLEQGDQVAAAEPRGAASPSLLSC